MGLAVVVAAAAAVTLGLAVERLNPEITIVIQAASVERVALAALIVGAVGALVPLRRVVAVDPASAFRSAS